MRKKRLDDETGGEEEDGTAECGIRSGIENQFVSSSNLHEFGAKADWKP